MLHDMEEPDQVAVRREQGREFAPCPPNSKLGVVGEPVYPTIYFYPGKRPQQKLKDRQICRNPHLHSWAQPARGLGPDLSLPGHLKRPPV